ncbi:MAG: carbohydrate ABC transporter permease [Peptococcaceae bacterium]|nr:carbohydrate ABC transporter permease [Peptococcaceae bacterium]
MDSRAPAGSHIPVVSRGGGRASVPASARVSAVAHVPIAARVSAAGAGVRRIAAGGRAYNIAARVLKATVSAAIGLLVAAPILYGLSMSLMRDADIMAFPPKIFPIHATLENYFNVVRTVPIFRFIGNSIVVSVSVCLLQLLTCSMAAYAFVFLKFRGRRTLFVAALATILIPGDATIISNFLTVTRLGMADTFTALIVPFATSATGIFLIRQFYMSVPKELKEAALIDGCGDFHFFVKILLPISAPVLGALAVFAIISTWNQYMWPLLITNTPENRTVQIGISMLQFSDGIVYGLVNAGCMLVLIPSITFFVICRKKMVDSLITGSVKG